MANELKPVYLITGADRPKIQRALRRLRDRIGETRSSSSLRSRRAGDDAVAACNALGLFGGGGRLVIVEDVEQLEGRRRKAVAAYLAARRPTPCWRSSAAR